MAICNENGVYQADETLALPRAVKGWKGGPIAEISLANLGMHWIWATSYQMHGGDWRGSSSPLMDIAHGPRRPSRAPSRDAAIEAASTYLRESMSKIADVSADARAVLEWLDALVPDQLDLFGAAA